MRRFEPQLPRGIIKPGDEGWRDFEREQRDRDRRYRDDLLDAPIVIETPLGKVPVSGVKNRSTSGNNGSTPGHNKPPGNPGTGGPPPIGGTPAQVSGLALTAGNGQVALTWDTVTGASYYIIYRSTSSGQETQYTTRTTNSYTDTNVSNGTTYYYQVAAVIGSTSGTKSTESSATPFSALDWWDPDSGAYQDTSATTAATANNDPVARLNGQTGNIGNLTNSGGTDRPLLKTAGVNGHGYLLFDGSNDFLSITASVAKPCTIVFAVYMVTWSNLGEIFGNTSAARGRVFMNSTTPGLKLQEGANTSTQCNDLAAATWGILSVQFAQQTSDSASIRVNNNARITLAGTGGGTDWTGAFQGLSFGKAYNLTNSNIRLGRIYVYSGHLSSTDEDNAIGNLMTYYGL